jgi:ATP-dependent exoDNAse (exonuclease V) beta subunit
MLGFEGTKHADEAYSEIKRLFYVAFTRAKYLMIMPKYNKYGKGLEFVGDSIGQFVEENPSDYKQLLISQKDTKTLKNEVKDILSKNSKDLDKEKEKESINKQDLILKEIKDGIKGKSTYKHSYSTLSHSKSHNEEELELLEEEKVDGLEIFDKSSKQVLTFVDPSEEHQLLPPCYPRGKQVGEAIHRVFELIDFTNYKVFDGNDFIIAKLSDEEEINLQKRQDEYKASRAAAGTPSAAAPAAGGFNF